MVMSKWNIRHEWCQNSFVQCVSSTIGVIFTGIWRLSLIVFVQYGKSIDSFNMLSL